MRWFENQNKLEIKEYLMDSILNAALLRFFVGQIWNYLGRNPNNYPTDGSTVTSVPVGTYQGN